MKFSNKIYTSKGLLLIPVIVFLAMASAIIYFNIYTCYLLPVDLECEQQPSGVAIDNLSPRLSWINQTVMNGEIQTAYHIQVASSPAKLQAGRADLWDSGKVESSSSYLIKYEGMALSPLSDCYWRVRVWDDNGASSSWSEMGEWHNAIFNQVSWRASWIGAPWDQEQPSEQKSVAPMFRKCFKVDENIVSAHAYISGLGYYELYINDKRIGDDYFVPARTEYSRRDSLLGGGGDMRGQASGYRVYYLTYDITKYINSGDNALGVILGNGFFGSQSQINVSYGSPRLKCQVYIKYSDGTSDIITSDQSWKVDSSPITHNNIYGGESYDAREEQAAWSTTEFDDSSWQSAVVRNAPTGLLMANRTATDKIQESFQPQKIEKIARDRYLVTFSEEISGWVRLKNITASRGDSIVIRPLNESQELPVKYIFSDKPLVEFTPRFTWIVFKEVEIESPVEILPENISAEAVYSDLEQSGEFSCSNEMLTSIANTWLRTLKDNMRGGIISDSPQREKSPYLGDAHIAMDAAIHNFDMDTFYEKWIADMRDSQDHLSGYMPNSAPYEPSSVGGPAWGAAMNIMPWQHFLHYGDTSILRDNIDAMAAQLGYMKRWITPQGVMEARLPDSLEVVPMLNMGDWSTPFEKVDDYLVHTFYLWQCADYTARAANILGDIPLRDSSRMVADTTRSAFIKKYYKADIESFGGGGSNVFALKMGMPDSIYPKVVRAMQRNLLNRNGNLNTGILGTKYLFEVLSDNGLHDMAYIALTKRTFPSFGYWLSLGATTTWERWDGTGSRNHYMFGGGLVWLYRKLAGVGVLEDGVGYRHILFHPMPVGDITWANYSTSTPYGKVSIHWEQYSDGFIADIEIPVGSRATFVAPTTLPLKNAGKSVIYRSSDSATSTYTINASGKYRLLFQK